MLRFVVCGLGVCCALLVGISGFDLVCLVCAAWVFFVGLVVFVVCAVVFVDLVVLLGLRWASDLFVCLFMLGFALLGGLVVYFAWCWVLISDFGLLVYV